MPDPHDLDLKLLDRSLEAHAAERQGFVRDLKIVVAAVFLFQFGVFFRYVDLSDQGQKIAAEAEEVADARAALKSVQDGLGAMGDLLEKGGAKVADDIKRAPAELRGKIVGLLVAPATKIAGIVQAPAGQLARVIGAYSKKEAA